MVLPIIIAILAAVFVIALIGLSIVKRQGRKKHYANRYARKRKQPRIQEFETSTKEEPQFEPALDDDLSIDDADEILGLRAEQSTDAIYQDEQPVQQVKTESRKLLVVFHVMAEDGRPYSGYELLQSLLAVGLRYGAMNIFHRHEYKTGRGKVWFSLASAVAPGTFDLQKMGSFSTQGLTLFMDASTVDNSVEVFNCMLETVGTLVDDLGGLAFDDQHKKLTKDKVVALSKEIRELEQSQRIPDLFAH